MKGKHKSLILLFRNRGFVPKCKYDIIETKKNHKRNKKTGEHTSEKKISGTYM